MEKQCSKCKSLRELKEFDIKGGIPTNECKLCRRARDANRKRIQIGCPVTKYCPVCELTKQSSKFRIEPKNEDKLANVCVECARDKQLVNSKRALIKHICAHCKVEKYGDQFPVSLHSYTTIYSTCKQCISTERATPEYLAIRYKWRNEKIQRNEVEFRKKEREDAIRRHKEDPRIRILQLAKTRAKKKGIEYNLVKEDLIIPEVSPVLGIPIIIGTKGNYEQSPSLDKIDNSKGYVVGNIQVISKKANSMKNSGTPEELKALAKWIIENIP